MPLLAGSHPIKAMGLRPETFAQSDRWQRQQITDRFDAQLEKGIAKISIEIQTIQRTFLRRAALLGTISEDRHSVRRLGHRVGAEAGKAYDDIREEILRLKLCLKRPRPFFRRDIETLEPAAVEPKNPRFLSGRFNFGSKAHQLTNQCRDRLCD